MITHEQAVTHAQSFGFDEQKVYAHSWVFVTYEGMWKRKVRTIFDNNHVHFAVYKGTNLSPEYAHEYDLTNAPKSAVSIVNSASHLRVARIELTSAEYAIVNNLESSSYHVLSVDRRTENEFLDSILKTAKDKRYTHVLFVENIDLVRG